MDILAALYILKDQALHGEIKYRNRGICYNLSQLKDFEGDAYIALESIVEAEWEGWSERYSKTAFPIPDDATGSIPLDEWKPGSKQLAARISLIEFLIEKLEDGDIIIRSDYEEEDEDEDFDPKHSVVVGPFGRLVFL